MKLRDTSTCCWTRWWQLALSKKANLFFSFWSRENQKPSSYWCSKLWRKNNSLTYTSHMFLDSRTLPPTISCRMLPALFGTPTRNVSMSNQRSACFAAGMFGAGWPFSLFKKVLPFFSWKTFFLKYGNLFFYLRKPFFLLEKPLVLRLMPFF